LIDQTVVPERLEYITVNDHRQMAKAIRQMVVRGAPAIGVAAAMGMALAAHKTRAKDKQQFLEELRKASAILCESRPTAWNLFWAVNRIIRTVEATNGTVKELTSTVEAEAMEIAREDVEANHKIGAFGSELIRDGDRVLTHCNAGTFATVSYGTALAPIRTAVKEGKKVAVIATETRPRLQGARLTAFELLSDRIPVTLIVDGAVGYVMKKRMAQLAIVGADRITSRFVANKIGTYQVALAAKANQVPFYVAAPWSTFHLSEDDQVEIEERPIREVTHIGGRRVVPKGVSVFNPAFDVTPIDLVSGFITEKGVIKPQELSR